MSLYGHLNSRLAAEISVSREVVRQWRNADCMPSPTNVIGIRRFFGDFELLPDFIKPICQENLREVMLRHGLDDGALRRIRLCPPDSLMCYSDIKAITRYIKHRHDVQYVAMDIVGAMPIRQWAKREDIPLARARALFANKILLGGIDTQYGLVIPMSIEAPEDSKRLVTQSKSRPQWGVRSLPTFRVLFNDIMNVKGISNAEMADHLGVNVLTVTHWRTGERVPEEANMQRIADYCECFVSDLLLDEEDVEAEMEAEDEVEAA